MNYYLIFSQCCLIQIIDNLLSTFLIIADAISALKSLFESINKTPEPNGSSGVGFVIADVRYKLLIRYIHSLRYYFSDLSTDEIHFIIEYILAMDIRSFLSIIAVQIIWHIFYEAFFIIQQHRSVLHIRSVQMSTERKMCCMEFLLVTICTAPFLLGMYIL